MSGFSGLELGSKSIVAVVGCGGKTSLIKQLAQQYRHTKVLVSPTTKIYPMQSDVLCTTNKAAADCMPRAGVTCCGAKNAKTGKLEALDGQVLEQIMPRYDLVLLEADGSRGLPCKGWQAHEPVIPACATHTIGVVTLGGLGRPATENWVHNLPEFLALTGLKRGETIGFDALAAMVCGQQGMLRNAVGRPIVLLNQVESARAEQSARTLLAKIERRSGAKRPMLLYGSVQQQAAWTKFYKEESKV